MPKLQRSDSDRVSTSSENRKIYFALTCNMGNDMAGVLKKLGYDKVDDGMAVLGGLGHCVLHGRSRAVRTVVEGNAPGTIGAASFRHDCETSMAPHDPHVPGTGGLQSAMLWKTIAGNAGTGDTMGGFRLGGVTRRTVLGTLAALPAWGGRSIAADGQPPSRAFLRPVPPVTAANQVLNVMQFEGLAREALPPAHFGYLATGNDDDRTVARNQEAFSRYEIRSRRFVDVSRIDTACNLYGIDWPTPIYLSAVSSQGAFHPDAELGTTRAARTRSTLMMLSTVASTPVEPVTEARGAPVWQQLYATDDWRVTEAVVKRAEHAGCTAIVLTVDSMPGRNSETLMRAMQADSRICTQCHINNSHDQLHKPMFAGLDMSNVHELSPTKMTWELLDKLRKLVRVKLLVKGIVTGEDAALSIDHGIDGIVVSNHGGRQEETLRSTIECLPEIAAAVHGRAPVLLDGGVRRGTDVFKALALGATAVGIGRPQGWGLAAFGQSGVEAVLDILRRELVHIMQQAGTPTLASITREHVVAST